MTNWEKCDKCIHEKICNQTEYYLEHADEECEEYTEEKRLETTQMVTTTVLIMVLSRQLTSYTISVKSTLLRNLQSA